MTIAILADTHLPRGRRRLPDRCLHLLAEAELIVHAGDFSSQATVEMLASLGPPLLAVHGNVDEPEVVAGLPLSARFEAAGQTVAVIHDAGPRRGRLARLRRRFPGCDAVVFGHSHLPLLERDGAFQIFNPGSPTERRRAPSHTMGLLEAEGGELRFRHVEL
jgi:uncharacterized protein